MTHITKQELIKTTKPRYLKTDKKGKNQILDEFCSNTGFNSKYAIQIMQVRHGYNKSKKYGRKARKKVYNSNVMLPIIKISESLEYPLRRKGYK